MRCGDAGEMLSKEVLTLQIVPGNLRDPLPLPWKFTLTSVLLCYRVTKQPASLVFLVSDVGRGKKRKRKEERMGGGGEQPNPRLTKERMPERRDPQKTRMFSEHYLCTPTTLGDTKSDWSLISGARRGRCAKPWAAGGREQHKFYSNSHHRSQAELKALAPCLASPPSTNGCCLSS
jgi:hypothetical protein